MSNLVNRLKDLDSCAVSDALDALGIIGVALGIHAVGNAPKIVGQIITMKLKPVGQEVSRQHLGTRAITMAHDGDVIVVDHGKRDDVSGWGGILSLAAMRKGLAGVIVDGACRDVDESREMGFPVYARQAVPRTARGRVIEESVNQPVTIGEVLVYPGDYVLADGSGVVFISQDRVEEVVAAAEKIASHEALMAEAIRQGKPVIEVMGTDYEVMLKEWH